jgi:hypothetical protein
MAGTIGMAFTRELPKLGSVLPFRLIMGYPATLTPAPVHGVGVRQELLEPLPTAGPGCALKRALIGAMVS